MLLIKQQQRIHFISRFRKTYKPFLNHGTIGLSKLSDSIFYLKKQYFYIHQMGLTGNLRM